MGRITVFSSAVLKTYQTPFSLEMSCVSLGLICLWSHQRCLWKGNRTAATFRQASGGLFCVLSSLTLHLAEESLSLKAGWVPIPMQMSTAEMNIHSATESLFGLLLQGKKRFRWSWKTSCGIASLPGKYWKVFCVVCFVFKSLSSWKGLFLSDP